MFGRWLGISAREDLATTGIEIIVVDDRIDTIFIHIVPEVPGASVYDGPLFRGLKTRSTYRDIGAVLGEPDETGVAWVKYLRPEAQIHFQFVSEDGASGLYMVTLMRPDWKPGS